MPNAPETTFRDLTTGCHTIGDVWAAVKTVPSDEIDAVLTGVLRHALDIMENGSSADAQRRQALQVVDVVCDRVLYVMMGVPRSPAAEF
jgi:hypothetical protein